ncbi:MAG TPA: secondary thiamine-phosphate synthase enzyme YjbQ [Actinomycetota bacterium]|nr:secondary thiamine-phosphate synthase enzyme YjbQ [Actinomycetota bacterium]
MRSQTTSVEVTLPARYAYLDLTEELQRAIKDAGVTEGAAIVYCPHTTCALLINEWEDGALEDFRERLRALVPDDAYYAHDDLERRTQNLDEVEERRNGHAHVKAMLLSASSQAIPVSGGEPMLGRWQRLILLELDDPKERRVVFHVFGE